MPYLVDLPVFQGPLDLLLHLVRRHEMDIYDIPIAALADQYVETLSHMAAPDLDTAGDFLVMAASLLEIKSRMLLPVPPGDADVGEPEDPRAELTRRLLEYQAFKEAAEGMRELEAWNARYFARGDVENPGDYPHDGPPYRDGTLKGLMSALQRMLERAASDLSLPGDLPRDRWTIPLKMREITRLLQHHPQGVWFHETMEPHADRVEIIVTFLAILEMLKRGRLRLKQAGPWSDIMIVSMESPPPEA